MLSNIASFALIQLVFQSIFQPGEEETPVNFNVKDVFDITRKLKALASNLVEEYNEFVPQTILDKYREMLSGGSFGENLGIMVKSTGRHRLVQQREESEEDSDEREISM